MNNVEHFKRIALEICNLYEAKNKCYNNSFGETYQKLGIVSAVTRISDKYNRLCTLAKNPDVDDLGESIEDTLRDMAAYSIMTLMEMRGEQLSPIGYDPVEEVDDIISSIHKDEIMDFVTFEIAKKLKEKGYPQVKKNTLAMYDEVGNRCSLAKKLDDFDDKDCVCPIISQVLKWLRDEHCLHLKVLSTVYGYKLSICDTPDKGGTGRHFSHANDEGTNDCGAWNRYEDCVLYGIKYVLDNLI